MLRCCVIPRAQEEHQGRMIWLSDRNWLQGLKVSSLAHMIKEYSPKAKSMTLLIHIILILVTLPSLPVLEGGSETPSMALKTFTP